MRRVAVGILTLALGMVVTGCSSMVLNVSEPQAAQLTFAKGWGGWAKQSTALPATVKLSTHDSYTARITNIPLHSGVTVYAHIKTYGNTEFSKAGQVPLVINAQDIEDVSRGNVVRIVIVDPKKEFQTARFVQLRLSPTEDAMKRGKEIGKPLALVVLGNRDPYTKKGATSYAK